MKGAVFLEQTAICFLQCSPPMPRKYAMHLILSGHRYLKCGQVIML
jgi:ER-Golgi trafficking TRAPP I complex 85 kDa subunit